MECWASRTNRNIDTLGQGMCLRQTLRDRTCLWTKPLHSPNRKQGSGIFSRCECLPETVDEKRGELLCGFCAWTQPPFPAPPQKDHQKLTQPHHSTAQYSSRSNHDPNSWVLYRNGGFFPLDHPGSLLTSSGMETVLDFIAIFARVSPYIAF